MHFSSSACSDVKEDEILSPLLWEETDELFGRIQAAVVSADESNEDSCHQTNRLLELVSSRLLQESSFIRLSDLFETFSQNTEGSPFATLAPLRGGNETPKEAIDAREVLSFLLRIRGDVSRPSSLYFFCVLIRNGFHQLAVDMFRRHTEKFSDVSVVRRKVRVVLAAWCGDIIETFYRVLLPSLLHLRCRCSKTSSSERNLPLPFEILPHKGSFNTALSPSISSLSINAETTICAEENKNEKFFSPFGVLSELERLFMDIAACQCADLAPLVIPLALYFPIDERERKDLKGMSPIRSQWCHQILRIMTRTGLLPYCTSTTSTCFSYQSQGERQKHQANVGSSDDSHEDMDSAAQTLCCSGLDAITFLTEVVSQMPIHISTITSSIAERNSIEKNIECQIKDERIRALEAQKVMRGGRPLQNEEEKMISIERNKENALTKLQLYDVSFRSENSSTFSVHDISQLYIGCLSLIHYICEKMEYSFHLSHFVTLASLLDTLFPVFHLCFEQRSFFSPEAHAFLVFLLDRICLPRTMRLYSSYDSCGGDTSSLVSVSFRITMQSSSLHFLQWVDQCVRGQESTALEKETKKRTLECSSLFLPSSFLPFSFWTVDRVVASLNGFQRQYFDLVKLLMQMSVYCEEKNGLVDYAALTIDLITRCHGSEKIKFMFLLICSAPHASVAGHFLRLLAEDWKKYQKYTSIDVVTSNEEIDVIKKKKKVCFEVLLPQLLVSSLLQIFSLIENAGRDDLLDTVIRLLNFFALFIAEDRRCVGSPAARCLYNTDGRVVMHLKDNELCCSSTALQGHVWHGAVVALGACLLPQCEKLLEQISGDPSRDLDSFSLSSIIALLKNYF